jgi:hypothetical protein
MSCKNCELLNACGTRKCPKKQKKDSKSVGLTKKPKGEKRIKSQNYKNISSYEDDEYFED